jgi:dimeric dUTPase (all-alpha-NTP-PPase superfamily)
MGKLQEMLNKQYELQERLGTDFGAMTAREITAFIKEHSIHVNQEMNEMLYELPFFKPWKNYDDMTSDDIDAAFMKAQEEYIDFMHFALNIGLALGFTECMMARMYLDKNKENHRRQDEGYTHDKQYR